MIIHTDYDRIMVKRLRELAAGVPPCANYNGICYDVQAALGDASEDPYAYARLEMVFVALGLHSLVPLMDQESDWMHLGKWEGERGRLRRDLAAKCADLLENELKLEGE